MSKYTLNLKNSFEETHILLCIFKDENEKLMFLLFHTYCATD